MLDQKILEEGTTLALQFKKRGGLLPVIVQEYPSGTILMQGYVNQEAINKTIETGYATFWSTSRQALWTKGETSGDYLKIKAIFTDCDQDALLYQVELMGNGVCHTKNSDGKTRKSCFYRQVDLQTLQLKFQDTIT